MTALVRVHAVEPRSRANGPGARFVVWFQGCTLACPGCYNPGTHAATGGELVPVGDLLARLAVTSEIEGVSLSGGEPMQQPDAALALVRGARALGLSTLMFSGYTLAELGERPQGPAVLAALDVLVDGRYQPGARVAAGLLGSANQVIHLLTDRYTRAEVLATPVAEIRIDRSGAAVVSGVNPLKLLGK